MVEFDWDRFHNDLEQREVSRTFLSVDPTALDLAE
jgi:hypothetical protein